MTAPQISAPTRRSAPLRRGILAGSILALLAGQSLAQTWNGGGGDNSWGTGANWAGGLAPAPGALTDLIFAGLVRLTPIFNYTDGDDFHDITFAAGAGAFTINPDTGVASKGIDWFGSITNSSASVQTLGFNLYLQGGTRTLAATTNALVINGNVFNNGNSLTISGSNSTSLNGLLTLQGATQTITVGAGSTLNLANIDYTHTGGAGKVLTLAGAGNTNFTGALSNVFNGSSQLAITSTGITDVSGVTSNAAAGQLMYTVGAGSTLRSSSGNFMGSFVSTYPDKLRFLGSGTFNATGTFTLGGVSGGNTQGIRIENASTATFNVNSGSTLTVPAAIGEASGAGKLTKTGAGTMILNGSAVNTYTGLTSLNQGTLTLDFANLATPTNLISSTSPLSLGGGTLSLLGKNVAAATSAQTFGGTTVAAGATTVSPNKGASATSVTLTLGAVTRSAGGTVSFTPNTAWAGGGTTTTAGAASTTEIVRVSSVSNVNGAVTMPGAGSFAYIGAGFFNGTGTGTRYLVANGAAAGPYQLVGAPTSTAFVTTGGSASTVYSFSATQNLTGATTNYAALGNNSGAATISTTSGTYTLNGYLGINSGLTTISGANNVIIGAERDFVVNNAGAGGLTISSVVANNGGGASSVTVSSTGAGVLTLSNAANLYSGGTYLNSGTLAIAVDLNLGAAPGIAAPGNLTFNGGTLSITPTGALTLATNRGIALNAGGGTITNTAAQTVTYAGVIAGSGGLTLNTTSTTGAFTISGANTFTGGATLSGVGTLIPTVSAAFGTGALTLNGSQIRSTTGSATTLANPVTIAANTTFPAVASEQSLIFSGATVLSAGSKTLNSAVGSTVGGRSVQFTGNISESTALSGLTKSGAGELFLSGVNTFTGPTALSAGRLTYGNAASLYNNTAASWTATNLTISGGATLALRVGGTNQFTSANVDAIAALGTATGGFLSGSYLGLDTTAGDFSYATPIVNTNGGANTLGFVKIGANKLTLSGANTYTGTTFAGGGTLVARNPSAFGPANNNVYFFGSTNSATSGGQIVSGSLEFATDSSVNAYNLFGSTSFASTLTLSRANSGPAVTHTLGKWTAGNNILNVAAGTNNASGTPGVIFGGGMDLSAGSAGTSTLNPTGTTISITGAVNIGTNNQLKTLALDGNTAGNSISGAITNGLNTLSLSKTNALSTWTLSGANTYTGTTTVTAGTLILSGTNTGAGATSIVGGTLQAGANGALNPNSAYTMTNAAAALLDLNGNTGTIGSLAGGGATGGNVTLGAGTLTTGNDNTSTSYSGNISGGGGLTKTGSGTFTLATAQGYTGNTLVSGGTLLVNSTLASTATTVANSATLGGTGTLTNAVTVQSGGLLSPATGTTPGTITIGSLTLDAGSTLAYEFGGTSDLVNVTTAGGLTINGGAFSLYATGGVSPLTVNNTYTLFTYSTPFSGSLANLSVTNSQAGKTYAINDTGSAIQLILGTATSADWSGTFGDGLWTSDGVGGNWNGAAAPNTLGAVANFGNLAGSATTVTLNGSKTVGTILFDNTNAFTIAATGADAITLDNGIAAATLSVTTGSHTISAPIVLNGSANITPAAGTSLTFSGAISGNKTLTFSGAGAATLSGANSYSLGTNLNSGTLNLASAAALGTGPFTIAGGTLDNTSGGLLPLSTNNPQTWGGNFTFTGSNALDLGTGAVSIPVSRTVTVSASTLTVGGVISGAGLTKAGAGTLKLTGNNTFTGALTLAASGGTVILSGNNSARPAGTTGLTTVNNGATLQLQANAGNTTAGVSTALSPETTANQPLALNTGGTLQLRSDSAVTFAGANNFGGLGSANVTIDVKQLTGAGSNNALTLAPGGFSVSGTTINVTGGNGYSLRLPAITSVGANTSTYNPTTANLSLGTYTATAAATLGLGGTSSGNLVTGVISNGTGSITVLKTGTSTWDLQGANTYTGNTTVQEGTLTLSGARTNATTMGTITVSNTAGLSATLNISAGTLSIVSNGQINVGNAAITPATGTVNQTGGAVVFTNVGNQLLIGQNPGIGNTGIYNLSGGSITTPAVTSRGVILGVNTSATGVFNLSGTGQLNMTTASGGNGDSTLEVGRFDSAADNTTATFNQTGGTANIGILSIGGNAAISVGLNSTLTLTGGTFTANQFPRIAAGNTNTATINIGGTADVTLPAFPTVRGTSSTATLNFDGGTLRPLAASTTYLGGLTNAFIKNGGAKLDVSTGRDITVSQVLENFSGHTGALTKDGVGKLTLTGASTFTGGTTVTNGTLQLGTGAGGGTTGSLSGTGTITNNATLAFNRSNAIVQGTDFGSVIAGSGVVNHIGTGTTTFSGANTYTGVTTVSAGTLQLNRGTADNSAIPTDANTATTSDMVINGGNLVISASEQIGDSGSINLSSGAFNFGAATGLTETIDKLTVSGGAFTTGANQLIVGGATVTWSGGTNTISSGGLVSDKHWVITGGTNTVQQNGLLRVQNGTGTTGLHFGGTGSPTITVDLDATNPGVILLKQDVFVDNTLTAGTAQILNGTGSGLSGQIDMNGGTRTFDIGNNNGATTDLLISTEIANGALTKTGAGTLAFTGANTYTGQTTVSAGILKVDNDATTTFGKITGSNATPDSILVNSGGTLLLSGSGDHIVNTTTLTLAGGTFDTGGVSETLGTLTLTDDSTIDFGGGASTLSFADSTGLWTSGKTLSIWNWSGNPVSGGGGDQLRFASNGLDTNQLAQINFFTGAGTGQISITPQFSTSGFVSFGEVVPVPEPSSVATVLGLLGLVGWRERRKGRAARRMERCQ